MVLVIYRLTTNGYIVIFVIFISIIVRLQFIHIHKYKVTIEFVHIN
jgi:hypothetical protein